MAKQYTDHLELIVNETDDTVAFKPDYQDALEKIDLHAKDVDDALALVSSGAIEAETAARILGDAQSVTLAATDATSKADAARIAAIAAAATDATSKASTAQANAIATAAADATTKASASQTTAITTAAADATTKDNAVRASSLQKTQNLNDLADKPTARTNLGLGTAAELNAAAFDAAGAANTAQAAAISAASTDATTKANSAQSAAISAASADATTKANSAQAASLQKSSNLSDLASTATARSNLGLGTAATQPSSAFDAAGAATTAQAAAIASAATDATTKANAAQAAAATDATSKVATETARATGAEATLAGKDALYLNAEDHGVVFDAKRAATGTISAGNNTLTIFTATPTPPTPQFFLSSDVGKLIVVKGAGAAGAPLVTTIATYVHSGQVTLTASATTAKTNTIVDWGSDQTTNLRAFLALCAATQTGSQISFQNGSIIPICLGAFFSAKSMLITDTVTIPRGVSIERASGSTIRAAAVINGPLLDTSLSVFSQNEFWHLPRLDANELALNCLYLRYFMNVRLPELVWDSPRGDGIILGDTAAAAVSAEAIVTDLLGSRAPNQTVPTSSRGVWSSNSIDNLIEGGVVNGADIGVQVDLGGSEIVNVHVWNNVMINGSVVLTNNFTTGFLDNASGTLFSGCIADTPKTTGFRLQGSGARLLGCKVFNSATLGPDNVANGANVTALGGASLIAGFHVAGEDGTHRIAADVVGTLGATTILGTTCTNVTTQDYRVHNRMAGPTGRSVLNVVNQVGSTNDFITFSTDDGGIVGRITRNGEVAFNQGGLSFAILAKTANYTLTATDAGVLMNGTNLTLTVPASGAVRGGRQYIIKNINATPLTVSSTSNIDGVGSVLLYQNETFIIWNDNDSGSATWRILVRNRPLFSGITGSRPAATSVAPGSPHFDTTLGKPIWSNGTTWKDATGTTV